MAVFENLARDQHIQIRCTAQEKERWKNDAVEAGHDPWRGGLSEHIRTLLDNHHDSKEEK